MGGDTNLHVLFWMYLSNSSQPQLKYMDSDFTAAILY